ncbi:hypothetical protein AB0B28_05565 [Glycomyces sp. NPDC046736]|uniref:hypothetical protein n=1 Tax=Glycomyces sp. NPDC046736 TaxID=3155615 RepID=UPI0033F2AA47
MFATACGRVPFAGSDIGRDAVAAFDRASLSDPGVGFGRVLFPVPGAGVLGAVLGADAAQGCGRRGGAIAAGTFAAWRMPMARSMNASAARAVWPSFSVKLTGFT